MDGGCQQLQMPLSELSRLVRKTVMHRRRRWRKMEEVEEDAGEALVSGGGRNGEMEGLVAAMGGGGWGGGQIEV